MIIDFIIEDLMLNSYLQKNFHTLETENRTPPTKARQTGRAFPIPQNEYELSMIIIFLVFRQNTVFIGNNLFGEGLVERDSEVWRALEGFSSLPELFI